ncbi:unnamed protein product [Umbelopsis ramanniana]
MADNLGYAYAAVVFVGGLIGYIKAGSLASFISGTVFGSLITLGAYQASQSPSRVGLAFVVALALMIAMGIRFSKGRKFMPAGLITILSLVMAVRYGARLLK